MNEAKFNIDDFLSKSLSNKRTLSRLSFCNGSKVSHVESWYNELRTTQAHEASQELYESLPEIPQLKTDKKTRFSMLEILRPATIDCIESLSQEFLNQSVVLDEKSQKTAIVAQSLQKYLLDGYMACIHEACSVSKLNNASIDILTTSLHRAITSIGFFILRSFQLYTQPPKVFWQKLHGLYQIAAYYGIEKTNIKDGKNKFKKLSTIYNLYCQCLLLGACRSNQLSQTGIETAFSCFANLGNSLKLVADNTANKHMHFIDPNQPLGPQYIKAIDTEKLTTGIYYMDMGNLLSKIKQDGLFEDSNNKVFPSQIENHLIGIWEAKPERFNQRLASNNESLEVGVGLSSTHYFVSNNTEFDQFLTADKSAGTDDQNFINAFTPNNHSSTFDDKQKVPIYQMTKVSIVDKGPNGYCISWKGEIPSIVESGQTICVRENNLQPMSLCLIRWIKQLKNSSKMGIQILSKSATAAGVAQLFDMGGYSDSMRALIVQNHSDEGPDTQSLLAANAPLKPQTKIKLFDGKNTHRAFLEDCILATSKLRQFKFRYLTDKDSKN